MLSFLIVEFVRINKLHKDIASYFTVHAMNRLSNKNTLKKQKNKFYYTFQLFHKFNTNILKTNPKLLKFIGPGWILKHKTSDKRYEATTWRFPATIKYSQSTFIELNLSINILQLLKRIIQRDFSRITQSLCLKYAANSF